MATLIAVRTTKSAPAHRSAVVVDSSLIAEAKIIEVITSVMARDGMLIQRRTVLSSAVAGVSLSTLGRPWAGARPHVVDDHRVAGLWWRVPRRARPCDLRDERGSTGPTSRVCALQRAMMTV